MRLFARAAERVVAPVGDRREERVDQIAVRAVDLERCRSRRERARRRRRRKASIRSSISPIGQLARRGIALALGHGARADRRPGRVGSVIALSGARRPRAVPRWRAGRHGRSGCRAQRRARGRGRRCRARPAIWPSFPDAGAAMGDAAVAGDARRLDEAGAEPAAARTGHDAGRCQSCTAPSTAWYWHIGETTMRLRSVEAAQAQRREQLRASTRRLLGGRRCSRLPSSSSISASSSA